MSGSDGPPSLLSEDSCDEASPGSSPPRRKAAEPATKRGRPAPAPEPPSSSEDDDDDDNDDDDRCPGLVSDDSSSGGEDTGKRTASKAKEPGAKKAATAAEGLRKGFLGAKSGASSSGGAAASSAASKPAATPASSSTPLVRREDLRGRVIVEKNSVAPAKENKAAKKGDSDDESPPELLHSGDSSGGDGDDRDDIDDVFLPPISVQGRGGGGAARGPPAKDPALEQAERQAREAKELKRRQAEAKRREEERERARQRDAIDPELLEEQRRLRQAQEQEMEEQRRARGLSSGEPSAKDPNAHLLCRPGTTVPVMCTLSKVFMDGKPLCASPREPVPLSDYIEFLCNAGCKIYIHTACKRFYNRLNEKQTGEPTFKWVLGTPCLTNVACAGSCPGTGVSGHRWGHVKEKWFLDKGWKDREKALKNADAKTKAEHREREAQKERERNAQKKQKKMAVAAAETEGGAEPKAAGPTGAPQPAAQAPAAHPPQSGSEVPNGAAPLSALMAQLPPEKQALPRQERRKEALRLVPKEQAPAVRQQDQERLVQRETPVLVIEPKPKAEEEEAEAVAAAQRRAQPKGKSKVASPEADGAPTLKSKKTNWKVILPGEPGAAESSPSAAPLEEDTTSLASEEEEPLLLEDQFPALPGASAPGTQSRAVKAVVGGAPPAQAEAVVKMTPTAAAAPRPASNTVAHVAPSLSGAARPDPVVVALLTATRKAAPQVWHNGHILGCNSSSIFTYSKLCAERSGFGLPLDALRHGGPNGGLPPPGSSSGRAALLLFNNDDATLHGLFRWKPDCHFSKPDGARYEAFEVHPWEGLYYRPLQPWEWFTILPALCTEALPVAIPGGDVDALERMMMTPQAAPKPPQNPFPPLAPPVGPPPPAAPNATVLAFMSNFKAEDQAPMAHVQQVMPALKAAAAPPAAPSTPTPPPPSLAPRAAAPKPAAAPAKAAAAKPPPPSLPPAAAPAAAAAVKPAQVAAPKQAAQTMVWQPEEDVKRRFANVPMPTFFPEVGASAASPTTSNGSSSSDLTQLLFGSSSTQPAGGAAPADGAAQAPGASKPMVAPPKAYRPKLM